LTCQKITIIFYKKIKILNNRKIIKIIIKIEKKNILFKKKSKLLKLKIKISKLKKYLFSKKVIHGSGKASSAVALCGSQNPKFHNYAGSSSRVAARKNERKEMWGCFRRE